jgi:hypothetical protein
MAKKKNTRVRFLGGYAARKDLFGILSYPVGYDGSDVEHTRFFMVTPERWVHRPIEADVVSVVFEDSANGKCWWLLDSLWDIEYYQNEIVVSATSGLFIVRDGKLVPFDKPAAPKQVGYKLSIVDDLLLSIGTDQIFALENGNWKEWICPDNA